MSTTHVLVQGIPVPQGQTPGLRKEFSVWATQTPESSIQVSLFIRALQKFYDIPYDKTLSYFQVAGIHGFPGDLVWDNSKPPSHPRDGHMVYCTHNTITFPTWHRPYMLLFEQAIYQCMGDVIKDDLKFNSDADKQAWIKESTKWRLPYWDWALAANKGNVPALFIPELVKIRVPAATDGSQLAPETVKNPLYRYQLHVNGVPTKMGELPEPYKVDDVKLKDGTILPWAQCSGTSRWGIKSTESKDWSEGINHYESIPNAINSHEWFPPEGDILKHSVSDLVYRLLSNVQTWANFSSTVTNQDHSKPWGEWLSLEYIHNNLHGFIGGNNWSDGIGHMQNVPSAAFDPIFYMHHSNIDRLVAIWQTLNWGSWFTNKKPPPSKDPSPPLSTDPLPPFHHQFASGKVDYLNSDNVRHWLDFGYQYDVLERYLGESDEDYISRIRTYVDKTYRNTGQVLLDDPDKLFKDIEIKGHVYDDYLINVLYDRYALGGDPYTIHFFLGAIPVLDNTASTIEYSKHPRHVGSVYNFSSPVGAVEAGGPPRCANCAKQLDDGLLSTASVPLTISLYNAAVDKDVPDIQHLGSDTVEPYLANQLSWVAVSTSGEIISWDRLSKTKIFVLKGKARHFHDATQLSDYYDYEPLSDVTQHKNAGASHNEY